MPHASCFFGESARPQARRGMSDQTLATLVGKGGKKGSGKGDGKPRNEGRQGE